MSKEYIFFTLLSFYLICTSCCSVKSHNSKSISLLNEMYNSYYNSHIYDKFIYSEFMAMKSNMYLDSLNFSTINDTIYVKVMSSDNGDVQVLAWSNIDSIYFYDNYIKKLETLPLSSLEKQLIFDWDTTKISSIANPEKDVPILPRTIATLFRIIINNNIEKTDYVKYVDYFEL